LGLERVDRAIRADLAALATLPSRTAAEDLSTSGWRLWPDRDAAWTNDTLYLPSEIKLDQMPVNPPTDGWPALNDQQGMAVTTQRGRGTLLG
jgi:beta-galactosidase